ncbi:MAG TPA: hypothetical protein PLU30_22095 [Verrucomicrobiae bacterium]|nr:hypothetical protein [Verrucomicrobiae bacterium]
MSTTSHPTLAALIAYGIHLAPLSAETIWIQAAESARLSPLMLRASEVQIADPGALGDCLVPIIAANAEQSGESSYAEFDVQIPRAGTYFLWARLRYPTGQPESFAVRPPDGTAPKEPLLLGGSGIGVWAWHWDGRGQGPEGRPGTEKLRLEMSAGPRTLHVSTYHASATTFRPMRWQQAEPTFSPRLNILCLTDDPNYVPSDDDARQVLRPIAPTVAPPQAIGPRLSALPPGQWAASGRRPLPDWMRCPRWYTKDSWREELSGRHAGDIATLVRQAAANGASALRLSIFWGGEVYYQSHVAPHAPGLGNLDYLREAIDEAHRTGMRIVAYMNPNALYPEHPLFGEVTLRDAGGGIVARPAYGKQNPTARYACINHPKYRKFLCDVLQEIFTKYRPDGLYVDGLTPHVCFCEHCRARYRRLFSADMPADKFAPIPGSWAVWGEFGGDPQSVGDVENDPDARNLTELLYGSLVEITREFTATVKRCHPEAITAYHSHPKPACADCYDATLTEVYSPRPWVHTAWRAQELAGFSNVFPIPVLFNVYPHDHFTAAEARYKAFQGLAAGAYPNFWSTPGMRPVFDFMAKNADCLDFATALPMKFIALPRDIRTDSTQAATPAAQGVRYTTDRFLAPYVGAYSALMRAALPVVTLHRPGFQERLNGFRVIVLANMSNLSSAQVEAVRKFVREGGGLIATHETSLCDKKGHRRADFALADVFGAHYAKTLPAARRNLVIGDENPLGLTSQSPPPPHEEPHVAVDLTSGKRAASLTGGDLGATQLPAAVVNDFGSGRCVYLPGRFDAIQCNQPDPFIERLFADAVRWAANGAPPIDVNASGIVAVSCFEQPNRLVVHLVNHDRDSRFSNDGFRPIGSVKIRLQLPKGSSASRVHRLWTNADVDHHVEGGILTAELRNIGEYEALSVELKVAPPHP